MESGFTCVCRSGYTGDGISCFSTNANETELSTSSPRDLDEYCSVVATIVRFTESEHVEEIVHDILDGVVPDVIASVEVTVNTSNVSVIEATYESLAENLGSPTSDTGYSEFVEALNEIAIAEAAACSSSVMLNVPQLASQFTRAFSQELTEENLREIRIIFGEMLCAESMEQDMPTSSSGTRRCPSRNNCTCPIGGINSVLMCACEFFACLDPGDHIAPIFGFSRQAHRCLAFIVDTTGSMSEEISAARRIILDFVRSEEDLNEIRCYVLVPFNDYGAVSNSVGPITIAATNDPTELQSFYNAVQALRADAGGDTPEYSLDAMLQGLRATRTVDGVPMDLMVSGSQMIIITDANSKRTEITDTIISEANMRGVCIHFFVSDSSATSDGIYPRVARETSGTLIQNFANWQLASFISASAGSPCRYTSTTTTSRRRRSTSSLQDTFDVSIFAFLIQLSIRASSGATLSITRPGGTITTVVASANFAVFSEGTPQPGRWSVRANFGSIDLSVTQETAIDTTILYNEQGSTETTLTPPQACLPGQIAIVSTQSHKISSPELVLGLADGTDMRVSLSNCSNALLSGIINFPASTVNYQLVGYDPNGVMFEHSIEETATFPGTTCNINECELGTHNCHTNADCVDTDTGFLCICRLGYEGSGVTCSNINECSRGTHSCPTSAHCIDTIGSFTCTCRAGYSGDGKLCIDVDECSIGMNNCDENADCINTIGSFTCSCVFGYTGDGVTCTELPAPDVPRFLRAASITATTVLLEWQPPADLAVPVNMYSLILSEMQFGLENVTETSAVTSKQIFGLEEYNNYTCELRAVSIFGIQSQRVYLEFATLEAAPSGAPQLPSGRAISPYLIDIMWSPPPEVDINGVIEFYLVEVVEVLTGRMWTLHAVEEHIIVGPLNAGYAYTCHIAAFTIGQGPFTNYFIVHSQELVPTAPPENITVSEINSSSFLLEWEPPPIHQRNGIIQHYLITVEQVENTTSTTLMANTTQIIVRYLLPYFTYHVTIAAVTRPGTGPWSNLLTVMLPEAAPSVPPQNIDGFAVDHTTIRLMWEPPPLYLQNGVITQYIINVTERETGFTFQYTTPNLQIQIPDLHPDYIYECRVSAVTIAEGPFSEVFAVRALVSHPSGPPLNVTPITLTSHSIALQWEPPLPEDRNGPISGYRINVSVVETGEKLSLTSVTPHLYLDMLLPYTTYVFTIAATTEVGYGPYSVAISIRTLEEVPSEPQKVTISTVYGSSSLLSLSWVPPSTPNGAVTNYTIYCDELPDNFNSFGSGLGDTEDPISLLDKSNSTLSTTLSGNENGTLFQDLMPYTFYSCYVSANTSAGEGNFSIHVIGRTDESIPYDAPGHLRVNAITSTTCNLMWSRPFVPNGILILYTITYNSTSGTVASVTVDGNSTATVVTGLHPYTYYIFNVSASTRIGNGPSASLVLRTEEDSPSLPPQNLRSYVLGPRSASISWLPPSIEGQNGIILYYILLLVDDQLSTDDRAINTALTSHSFSDLEEYNIYNYSTAAATGVGVGVFSPPVQFTTHEDVPTAAPQMITVISHSSTLVTFQWSPPPAIEVNGFIRYYTVSLTERHNGRVWHFIALDSHINIGSLHPHYLYDFTVAAHTIGQGPFSDVYTVLTDEDVPTGSPQEVTASGVTSTTLTLTWSPPQFEDTNGIVRYYRVHIIEAETGRVFELTSNITSIYIYELHPYYTYECRIAAFTIDLGPYSNVFTVQLAEEGPTATPANVTAATLNSESIYLSWDPPPFGDQNGQIQHYIINVTELDTGNSFIQIATSTEFTFYSLHPHYIYAFTIAAMTVDVGPSSNSVIVMTEEDVPSGPVTNLMVEVPSSDTLVLQWDLPEAEDQNGIIISYVVEINATETGETFQLMSALPTLTIDTLQPFTTYLCRIAARTMIGTGPYSIIITATTLQDAPSSSPHNVSGMALSSSSIFLSWSPPVLDERNGIIMEYHINITELDTGNVLSLVSYNTFITVQFLHPYYTYASIVSAVTIGEGPYSEIFIITTPEDVPSGYPQSFMGTTPTSRSAIFTWDPPPPDQQNGLIVEYFINITVANSGETFQETTTENSLSIYTLKPFTTYFCIIAASTSAGIGPYSTVFTLQTPQDVPSTSPNNLIGIAIDSTTIHLSWSTPDSDDHNGIISEYRVNVTEVETGQQIWRAVTTTSIVIATLHPYYTYTWTVTAVTTGEGPYSPSSTVTTPEDVPSGPPENLTGEAVNSEEILLKWDLPPPQHQNGIIIGYTVNITALETGATIQMSTPYQNMMLYSLRPFTTYSCIVAARTSIGLGPFSTTINVQTLEDAPSSHPSNSTGYALNSTHIYLSWDPPPLEEINGVIREYRINVSEAETGTLLQYIVQPDNREFIIGSLQPFHTYHCIIVAYTVEVSPTTVAITVRTEEDAPSGPPTNVTANVISSTSILLSWAPPEATSLNGILRHYVIFLESDAERIVRNVTSSQDSVVISGLRPYTEYSCTIRAETVEVGPSTSSIYRTTLEDVPSGPPQSVSAEPTDPSTLVLRWQEPLFEERNGIIRLYIINVTELESDVVEQHVSIHQTITISSLHPYYVYRYSVAAQTVALGPFSESALIQMPEAASSSAPMNVMVSSISSTGFLLFWLDPPPEHQNGVICNYSIILQELNTDNHIQLVSQTADQRFDSLHPHYNYSIQVAAVTVAVGPYSPQFYVTTLSDVPSGTPQNFVVTADSSRSLQLTWESPTEISSNGPITGYTVVIVSDSGFFMEYMTIDTQLIIRDLSPFTTYVCSVAANTTIGQGPYTMNVSITTPEDAPEGAPREVAVSHITSNSVLLTWMPPQEHLWNGIIRHYQILVFELDTRGNYTYRATPSTTFRIGELHPFYSYNIRVQAITVGAGPLSPNLTVSTLQDAPSSHPTDIQAIPVNSTTLTLTWNPPPRHTQNGNITRYLINISASETRQRSHYMTDGVTTITLWSLHPHYMYSFTVAAATSVGVGPYSTAGSIRMPQDVPSSPPLNFTGEAVDSRSIYLSWHPPEPSERNGIIIGYFIQIFEVDTNSYFSFNRTNHTEFLLQQLHPYYRYECSIGGFTAVGRGPLSSPILVQTDEDAPSGSPVSTQARAINSTTIELRWELPPPEEQNGIVTSFQINITVTETKATYLVNSTANAVNVTELHPHYSYSLSVAAVTAGGVGPYSQPASAITHEDIPTGSPLNIMAVSINSKSILLSWEAPRMDLQNGIIRAYNVSVLELETGQEQLFTLSGLNTFQIVNSLHPFYSYNCSVAAFTIARGPIGYVTVRTPPEEPSDAPQSVAVGVVNATSVQISWQSPPPEHRNGIIAGYAVRMVGLHSGDNIDFPLTNGTEMVVEGLHPFYAYRFSVAAFTVGLGPFSNAVTQKLPESRPLGVITDIQVLVLTPTSVLVSWLPTMRDNWNGVIQYYTVYYEVLGSVDEISDPDDFGSDPGSGVEPLMSDSIMIPSISRPLANNPDPTLVTLPFGNESVVVEDLEEFHVYRFMIYYENSQGRSNSSAPVIIQTFVSVPSGPPTNIQAIPLTSFSIKITWDPPHPSERNGQIIGYNIEVSKSGNSDDRDVYNISGTEFSLRVEGLEAFTRYTVAVAARTVAGLGPYSDSDRVQTNESVPGAPEMVIGKVLNDKSISLNWKQPHQPNGIILGYDILYYSYKEEGDVENKMVISVSSNTTSRVWTDLTLGQSYVFTIRARTSVGFGNSSNMVTIKLNTSISTVIDTNIGNDSSVSISAAITVAVVGWILLIIIVIVVLIAIMVYKRRMKSGIFDAVGTRNLATNKGPSMPENHYTLSNETANLYYKQEEFEKEKLSDLDGDESMTSKM